MRLFPAIDIIDKKAVRLLKGDYSKMTVYSDNPVSIAEDFLNKGSDAIHIVDLEGAKNGGTPNIDIIEKIIRSTSLFAEIGGGIRDMDTAEKYLSIGAGRVILGTAALNDESFLKEAVRTYGEKIAVGVDIKDGYVAIKGWTEKSSVTAFDFCDKLSAIGVKTVICTDISRDGAMLGTNTGLYKKLTAGYNMDFTASGGVSSIADIIALKTIGMSAAIIGKAYYIGAIDLQAANEVAK